MNAPNWIPVAKELPDDEMTVLVFSPTENEPIDITFGFHENEHWYCAKSLHRLSVVTHWMPLPEPPQ